MDHAWTFRPETARQQLNSYPGLLERMSELLDLKHDEKEELMTKNEDKLIAIVMRHMWQLAQTYSIGNSEVAIENKMPVWYIVDEFAARIQHSDEPNFRMVPFISSLDNCAYSLLFPTRDCEDEEEITRDYLEGVEAEDDENREALKNIWMNVDMAHVDWKQVEPEEGYFMSGRISESLPNTDIEPKDLPSDKIKVYADYEVIKQNLNHPTFEVVENMNEADVLWLMSHFKDFRDFSELTSAKRINQFPYENVITVKDLLSIIFFKLIIKEGSMKPLKIPLNGYQLHST